MIELGSIGWDGVDEIVDMGDREDPDGVTLVRVQLFRGRDTTQPLSGRAQGEQIVCQVRDGLFEVPTRDSLAYIAIPDGMDGKEGVGLIIGTVKPGPERRRNVAAGNKFLTASEGAAGIAVNKNGSITLHTNTGNDPEGASVYFRVAPDKFEFMAPFGKLVIDASGFHLVLASGARLDLGGIHIPGLSDVLPAEALANFVTYCKISAGMTTVQSGTVILGAGEVFNPAMHLAINPGLPPPLPQSTSIQSQTVYIAP